MRRNVAWLAIATVVAVPLRYRSTEVGVMVAAWAQARTTAECNLPDVASIVTSLVVRHPEMAMLTRTDLLVGVGEAAEGVPAEFRICSLLHVASIEPVGTSASGPDR